MGNSPDPRHAKRTAIIQELFAASFNDRQPLNETAAAVWGKKGEIDPMIERTAPEWPLDKLNKIDLAILRLAVYELVVDKTEPVRVIIDEAVELAKDLGSENSPSFVNGVLGTIVKEGEENDTTRTKKYYCSILGHRTRGRRRCKSFKRRSGS